jgi:hypothetical protein
VTAGIPGTGIGGLFYLVSALAMPLRELRSRPRGAKRGSRWSVIAGQVAMASGVIAGMWATGWLLEVALVHARPFLPVGLDPPPSRLWPTATIVAGAGVLAAVLLGVEILRLVIHRGGTGARVLSVLIVTAAAQARVVDAQDAPTFTVLVGGIRDSDRNATLRVEGAFEYPAAPGLRLSAVAGRERVASGAASAGIDRVSLRTAWRPVRRFDVAARVGATRLDGAGGAGGATVVTTGEVRVRWRPALDFRLRRDAVTASPLLVANRVMRTEGRATIQAPVAGPLALRAIAGTAALGSTQDVNHRTSAGGAVLLAVAPAGEVSAQFHEIHFSHASAVGYFAPRVVQTAEVATYLEYETAGSALFVLDGGVGVRRLAAWGLSLGPWGRALRLYALIVTPIAPGRELRLELDGEDSAVAADVATAARWRYGSAAVSVRWAMR